MLDILYEDNHLLVVNKKASDIVQGDKTGDLCLKDLVGAYIKQKYNKPGNVFVGVAHRLDRPVSGAVVFARTSKALTRLNAMFADKLAVEKKYWAIVKNKPTKSEGQLVDYLVRNEKQNKSYISNETVKDAKKAILDYKLIAQSDQYFLLEVILHTGRHHQIRAQLSAMGCPIKGDLKYGYSRSNPDASISLHARSVSFIHPVSKEIVAVTAPVPDDKLWKYFETETK